MPVGDFQQPFEIFVELKGVMSDASVTHINKVHQKSRTLHCGAVSVSQQQSCFFLFFVCWIFVFGEIHHNFLSLICYVLVSTAEM